MTILYFAFGSNMDRAQMSSRVPGARPVGTCRLSGFQLGFTRRSQKGGGVADLIEAPEHEVWGVLYEMTLTELESLDVHEGRHGESWAYDRVEVEVEVAVGGRVRAWRYFVVAPDLESKLLPRADYLRRIIDGAKQAGLPFEYIQRLMDLECAH